MKCRGSRFRTRNNRSRFFFRYQKSKLDHFPKRFPSLKTEENEAKGIFPFAFNHSSRYGYSSLELPPREAFLDGFHTREAEKKYEEFLRNWPEGEKYDFKSEMHKYLVSDVRVLRGGCLRLVKELLEFQEELQEDKPSTRGAFFFPFNSPFFTISSFCSSVWRFFELEERTVFLLSNQRNARNASRKERVFIDYLNSQGRDFKTDWNQPEGQKQVGGKYFPDGIEVKDGVTTIVEVLGCMVHFHYGVEPRCKCPYTSNLLPGDRAPFGSTFDVAAAATKRKLAFYRSRGFQLITMWECQFDTLLKTDEKLRHFATHLDYPGERLKIRTALRGGRCETFRMLYNHDGSKRLWYIDLNSLYPFAAMSNAFPVGKPERLVGERLKEVAFSASSETGFTRNGCNLEGLSQASVLPPGDLFLPVLPAFAGGKLKFGLCAKCMEEQKHGFCKHSDKQRMLHSVWTTIEIKFAVECGYKLVKVHEMFVYKERKKIYESFFMRLARHKLESEPFPSHVSTPQEKKAYVDGLNEAMPGLDLQWEKVSRNDGRRAFAKLMSNCLLGKFSQSDVKPSVKYIYTFEQFLKLKFRSPKYRVKSVSPLSETLAEAACSVNDELIGFHKHSQTIVYSCVTSHARVLMAKHMRKLMELGCRIFYTGEREREKVFPRVDA